MRRFVLLSTLASVLLVPIVAAQSTPPAQPPAKPAKYIPPVKGLATIEVMQSSKPGAKEWVTTVKVRNTSKGPINLLRANEYWYDANLNIVSASEYRHRKAPIQPGEIVEFTMHSPAKPGMQRNQIMFTHAYGKVEAKAVKAFK
ncbi:MAG TPA: hypothetical protein VGD94_12085 [Vicinamibacterales bacterium]